MEPLLSPSVRGSRTNSRTRITQTHKTTSLSVFIVAAVDCGLIIVLVALTRIYENIVCRNWYSLHEPGAIFPGSDPPEKSCKIDAVQSYLAFLRGFEAVFRALPSK